MAVSRCSHREQVTGVLECDLLRNTSGASRYTAQFKVSICTSCGRSELYCESHNAVCEWLVAKSSVEDEANLPTAARVVRTPHQANSRRRTD